MLKEVGMFFSLRLGRQLLQHMVLLIVEPLLVSTITALVARTKFHTILTLKLSTSHAMRKVVVGAVTIQATSTF